MKFCSHCGRELADAAVVCPSCGCSQVPQKAAGEQDKSSAGMAWLGCCIPIVGLILWLVWKDDKPLKAKSAGKGALIGFIAMILFYVVYFVILAVMMAMGMMYW